ncbi:MAG: signal peptidase II [Actinobacteria bacterium]|nr:signal peptidase II [Actinomycetota bacterium]
MPRIRRAAVLSLIVVVLDQWTKHWAQNALDGGRTIEVVWTLRFALGYNSGFAFSTGTGWGPWIGLVAVAVVLVLVAGMRRADNEVSRTGLALVVGGAVGNIVDRLFRGRALMRGRVIDFIDLQWWPVFNVADSAITIGGLVLVVMALRGSGRDVDARAGAGGRV